MSKKKNQDLALFSTFDLNFFQRIVKQLGTFYYSTKISSSHVKKYYNFQDWKNKKIERYKRKNPNALFYFTIIRHTDQVCPTSSFRLAFVFVLSRCYYCRWVLLKQLWWKVGMSLFSPSLFLFFSLSSI